MEGTNSLGKKRNPSFELLRVIAMFMIITLHYNTHTDALLQLGIPATAVNIFANITCNILNMACFQRKNVI